MKLVVGVLMAGMLSTAMVATAAPTPATVSLERSVTLITGDRVVVLDSAGTARTVVPGTGRQRTAFSTYQRDGHMFVVPVDAKTLVAQGRLDERLFDVTLLLESGYDDGSRPTVPLIVTHAPGAAPMRVAGTTTTANLAAVNASAVTADKSGAAWRSLVGSDVRKVWLDRKRKASLDRSVAQIGATAAWQAGYTGAGVKVAVLDTGVDETHPDLASREIGQRNFSDSPDNVDRAGHGTHVASTIAGTGAKSGGKYKGVAHGASVLDGKVLDDQGYGYDSQIIAGMQWAVEQGAKIVNLSLGGTDTPEVDPLEEAVNSLSAKHDTLFVIAAGNSGSDESIASPGSADAALTVGAVDRADNLAEFSSRGPRTGDTAIKPDITAPGVGIVAAKATQSGGTPVEDGYLGASGTSMATPHVAGSAALVAQSHPDWTGGQIKAVLTASAKPNPGLNAFQQGSGRVDVPTALAQSVTTTPTNVSLGRQSWPYGVSVSKALAYHNFGKTDVTLDVTVNAMAADGKPAPVGLLTVSPSKVTVPAGGDAAVNVTANAGQYGQPGAYFGSVTALSNGAVLRTPVALDRETESYTATINQVGLDGAPATGYDTRLFGLRTGQTYQLSDLDGSATVRLPKDDYMIDSSLVTGDRINWVVHPSFRLVGDSTVELDFRRVRQFAVTPPDPTAALRLGQVGFVRTADRTVFGWLLESDLGRLWTAHVGPAVPQRDFTTMVNTQWVNPVGDFYGLAFYPGGSFPTGFVRAVKRDQLAHVRTSFGGGPQGKTGMRYVYPRDRSGEGHGAYASLVPVKLPSDRNEYYTTEGVSWEPALWQMSPDNRYVELFLGGPVRSYQSGRTYHESVNRGVFGPAMPPSRSATDYVVRSGNTISARLPLLGDSAGNVGIGVAESGSMVLYRDGAVVGESASYSSGTFTVPAEPGEYRLTSEAVRSKDISDVTTHVRAAWTFRSAALGANPARLPVSTIRFTPALDQNNSAPAGRWFFLPVTVQQQNSGTATIPRSLSVEASFDGGLTWTSATVVANALALVQHPNDATTVSLRAKATDRAGNTAEHTIINAYKLS
nr:S8 family serine peptidase [Kibdelosporangium sp. MJ126-NF4]CEL20899.1 peptidase S8 and S53, subtilisin, kexin, sedolisin [Kibdelosporangium sp. MJ126-NF4]CTQ98296.1 peptidase S8 and S53, subtilisin, kexin, sedolisin [Kibdelosporangium sp. MJ126-NF4]